jgi:signal transduction histidine kinase
MTSVGANAISIEADRIKNLKKYNILDTPPDGSFDRLTRLASRLLDVPIAIVSLVDTDRIWFKSRYGVDVPQIGRDMGLCASAILSDEFYQVENAIKDPRTLANPLVAGEFGLRFYAAVPLKTRDGYNLGTFCVIDKKPRQFMELQKEILEDLTDILMDQIELRLAARTAISNQNHLLSIAAHDLKNPITTINIRADLISQGKTDYQGVEEMCQQIKEAGLKMTRIINELLESGRVEAGIIRLHPIELNFADLIMRVVGANQALADNKNQQLHLKIENDPVVFADENKLTEIADNLINNAIKFSAKNKRIEIIVKEKEKKAILEVKDEGPGLTEEDKKNLFQRFTRLSAQPTNGEDSTGLGLSIVKVLVEAHKGNVWVESGTRDNGSKFVVEIPVSE